MSGFGGAGRPRHRTRTSTERTRKSMTASENGWWLRALSLTWVSLFAAQLSAQTPDYQNPDLPFERRVADLVSRMTLEEKASQMQDVAPAIPRLGIPAYNWWNEALHGVARSGLATSFPQAIGLAATWDDSLIFRMATVVSDEARAKHHEYVRQGSRERDLRESYLPHFAAGIREGRAYSLMCAYNRVLGSPACGSSLLLKDILRDEWGFSGYVVSDCGAINDIYERHKVVPTAAGAAALAVKTGTDLECGNVYANLVAAVRQGLITEQAIDTAVIRLFLARFRLGMFDPPERVRWAQIPISVLDQPAHRALARQVARESIVLLKNAGSLLPLHKALGTIAVIGPNADDWRMLLGNYEGQPADPITPLRGIREAVSGNTRVLYARGSDLTAPAESLEAEAVRVAEQAEVVVLCLGLTARLEGEEMPVEVEGFRGGDRTRIDLPAAQERLLERIVAVGKPTVLVLMSGSAVAVNWAQEHVPAIVEAWYGGQAAGSALADVLFGDYSPGGRLPVTFYKSVDDLPRFDDYRMAGRTYRFLKGTPLYPFGYGLSYTTFTYNNLRTNTAKLRAGDTVVVRVDVTNTGQRAGDEVAQLYVRHLGSRVERPNADLRGFRRVSLNAGETRTVEFSLPASSLAYWSSDAHRWVVEEEAVELAVGASSADIRVRRRIQVNRVSAGRLH